VNGSLVLDSWAVLAYLGSDGRMPRAMEAVERAIHLERAVMSWVNLGEVAYIVHRRFGREESRSVVQDLRAAVNVLLPEEPLFLQAAEIKARYVMAYADAFAAATAMQCAGELLTGDPELLIPGAPWRWRDLREVDQMADSDVDD